MFGTQDLALFVFSALLLNITPGPDTLYVVARSSTQGARAGAIAALGIGAGTLVHITAAALGLSALFAASATAFTVLKLVGAAYLVYVGISMMRSRRPNAEVAVAPAHAALRSVFIQGFWTNVLNPKVALFLCRVSAPVRGRHGSQQGARFPVPGARVQLQRHVVEPVGRVVLGSRRARAGQFGLVQPLRRRAFRLPRRETRLQQGMRLR